MGKNSLPKTPNKLILPESIDHSVNLLSTILHLTIHTLFITTMQPTGNQERQKLDFEDDEARRERLGTSFYILGNRDSLTIR
jgi:hypothetical protein